MKDRYISIKHKLTMMISIFVFCLFLCVMLLYTEGIYTNRIVDQSLVRQKILVDYFRSLSEMSTSFHNYLYEQTDENYQLYQNIIAELKEEAIGLADSFQSRSALDQYYMTLSLIEEANEMISGRNETVRLTELETFDANSRLISERFTILAKEMGSTLLETYEFTIRITTRYFYLGIAMLAICLISVLLTRRMSMQLVLPIEHLTNAATRILEGESNAVCDFYGSNDEMRICIQAFNRMVESLMEKVEVQRRKTELEQQLRIETERLASAKEQLLKSEILVLQSRINPHFLFNTLNNVTQLAYIEDAPRTLQTSMLLGKYLRYALDTFDRKVTLTDEMNNIKTYIEIQQERYENRIRFSVSDTEEGADAVMPSMIIEPLVENSISHGLKCCVADGTVLITVRCCDGEITIEVEDNGCGIEADKLDSMIQYLETNIPIQTGNSIGLHNVIHRLRLTFGEAFEWSIHSKVQKYTRVTLRFPYIPYH